jgi:UDP-glucose 4-epimerase
MDYKKVAVFGGAGFVGSSLVAMLRERVKEVLVVDSLFTGDTRFLPQEDAGITFVQGDITTTDWVDAFQAFAPDIVVNLAAIHFIPYCNRNPYEAMYVNTMGFQRILEQCKGVKGIVFASSAAVYDISDEPHVETQPMKGTDIYGLTKVQGEELLELWASQNKIPGRGARFFNVIGPNETNPHLLPEIFHQTRKGDVIELGNIDTKRDYIYVEDIARGILTLIETLDDGVLYDSYNIGTGKEYSARELIEILAKVSGRPIQAVSVPERYRPSDRMHLCADNSKLRAKGWTVENDIETSIRKTWEDFVATEFLKPYPNE